MEREESQKIKALKASKSKGEKEKIENVGRILEEFEGEVSKRPASERARERGREWGECVGTR